MSDSIDLRELRVFLVLAEELHFGRTARRLHLTPARISQSLRALETKLGGQLVHRTSRRVQLTALGERFRDEARVAYEQLDAVFERTRAAGRSFVGPFRLGLLQGGIEGPELPAIIRAFETRHPECQVQVSRPPFGDAFECVRSAGIDALVSWLPHGQPNLVAGLVLSREPRVLAVAHDHVLAERVCVSIEDVADYQTFSVMEELLPKEIAEAMIPSKTPKGRTIRRHPISLSDVARRDASQTRVHMNAMIASGEVVLPAFPAVEKILGANIVYVPIGDMPPIRRGLVWRRRASDVKLRDFTKVAREVLHPSHDRASGIEP